MATWQHLRSSTANKRPTTSLADGRIAINTNTASPGLFFKDSAGTGIVKVGPVHVGTTAPNSVPAAGGSSGNYTGEQWLDTSVSPAQMKVWNGSTWVGIVADELPVSKLQDGAPRQLIQTDAAGTGVEWTSNIDVPGTLDVTGATTLDSTLNVAGNVSLGAAATLTFEGATDDAFETTLSVTDPTADRSIVLPNVSGTVITTGDTGSVTSTMIADGTIVNADINASAAIAGTKISPDFGSQNVTTTGTNTAASFIPTSSTVPANGVYLPAANSVAISTGGSGRLFVDASGNVGVGSPSNGNRLDVKRGDNSFLARFYQEGAGFNADILINNVASASNFLISRRSSGESWFYNSGADPLVFHTNAQERLRITSAGLVGVGTSSPSEALTVAGNIRVNNSNPTLGLYGANGTSPQVIFGNSAGTAHYSIYETTDPSTGTRGSLNIYDVVAVANRVTVDTSGRVGVGTTSPSAKLTVQGGTTESNVIRVTDNSTYTFELGRSKDNTGSFGYIGGTGGTGLTLGANNTEAVRIDTSGRVGIGTSSPSDTLHVVGTSQITGSARFNNGIQLKAATQNYIYFDDALSLTRNGVGDRLTIDSSGRVGIGTTPDSRLHVSDGSGNALRIGYNPGSNNFNIHDAAQHLFRNNGGASEYGRFDSSGRLLVGTSSARTTQHSIGGNSVYDVVANVQHERTGEAGGFSAVVNKDDASGPFLNLAKARGSSVGSNTIVASGDVLGTIGFFGADGSDITSWGGAIQCFVDGTPGANDMPGRLVFSTTADGAGSPTERMRIDRNGWVLINNTNITPGFGNTGTGFVIENGSTGSTLFLSRDNNAAAFIGRNGDGTVVTFTRSGTTVGTISVGTSSTAYNTSSDYRLKENVTPVTDGITRLQQLKPSRFNFIADPAKTVDGFIAHEVQTVVPEAITGEKDAVDDDGNPVYQGIDQSKLVPLLTAALQEAIGEIESLKARVADLEAA